MIVLEIIGGLVVLTLILLGIVKYIEFFNRNPGANHEHARSDGESL